MCHSRSVVQRREAVAIGRIDKGAVLQQDADNVAVNQRGLNSDGFRGMYLGEQELRLRHFHQVLDQYLGRS